MNDNANFDDQKNDKTLERGQAISYAELDDCYRAHLAQKGKSTQEMKNARAAIKSWCESLGFNAESLVGDEFDARFESSIKRYISEQIALRIQKTTYSSRLSHIRAGRNFYLRRQKISSLPPTFGKRLEYLLNVNGYSSRKFWEHYLNDLISYESLLRWILGLSLPAKRKISVVKLIEERLDVPADTLTSTLESYRLPRSELPVTTWQQKNQQAMKSKYFVWTDALQEAYQDFIHFKTSVTLPNGMRRRKNSRWTGGKENREPPTSGMIKKFLQSFFGFCHLSKDNSDPLLRGLGMDKKSLSLAMLADIEIVEEYLTVFKLRRTGGVYNKGTLTFANFIASLLRKESGYLYQKQEFSGEELSAEAVSRWREKCLKARERVLNLVSFIEQEKASGGESFGFGRDPREPIRGILESLRPIHVTLGMLDRMFADVDKLKNHPRRRAILYRDILLLSMLQANPLRVKMFGEMRIGQHLIKKEDGSWWLKFKRHDFKNRHSLKGDYQVRVAPTVWHLIDRYISEFRPALHGAGVSDHLFLSSPVAAWRQSEYGLRPPMLGQIVANRTRQYIPDCPGFRPHAFRHIVATDIIKNNPEFGFFLAAKVLHDKLATVEANYAHLKTSDFFEPYNKLFSESWNSFNLSDTRTESSNESRNGQSSDSKEDSDET